MCWVTVCQQILYRIGAVNESLKLANSSSLSFFSPQSSCPWNVWNLSVRKVFSHDSTKLHPSWFDSIFTGAVEDRGWGGGGGIGERWWRIDLEFKHNYEHTNMPDGQDGLLHRGKVQLTFYWRKLTWSLQMWNLPTCQSWWVGLQERKTQSLKEGLDQGGEKKKERWNKMNTVWKMWRRF